MDTKKYVFIKQISRFWAEMSVLSGGFWCGLISNKFNTKRAYIVLARHGYGGIIFAHSIAVLKFVNRMTNDVLS